MRKEQRRNIKYLKREEWEELRGYIDNVRDKLIIELLYITSMRVKVRFSENAVTK